MLAQVTKERVLKVYEEPAASKSAAPLAINLKAELTDRLGRPWLEDPTGRWCVLSDLALPENGLVDPTLFFVEDAELALPNGRWSIRPRGAESPWNLGKVSDA
jgi:hypothetical protein